MNARATLLCLPLFFPSKVIFVNCEEDVKENESAKLLTFELLSANEVVERKLREGRPRKLPVEFDHPQTEGLYMGYGTHFVDLWVGSPKPQRQTVIVDTGSSITAFPCKGCQDCGEGYHMDDFYDPSLSKSFRKLSCNQCDQGVCRRNNNPSDGAGQCGLSLSYAEGSSWSAYEATDMLYFGGSYVKEQTEMAEKSINEIDPLMITATPFTFGCQTSLTGLFRTQLADGIMGLSKSHDSFLEQMHSAGTIQKKQFTLCYSRQPVTKRGKTGAGSMTIGGLNRNYHKSRMVYAKDVSSGSFFTVYVKKILLRTVEDETDGEKPELVQVGIDEATINSNGVIVDSGTTDTYLTSDLHEPFKRAWQEATGKEYSSTPLKLSNKQLRNLPTILFQLQGVDPHIYGDAALNNTAGLAADIDPSAPFDVIVALPSTHYMSYNNGKYYSGIHLDGGTVNILGANAMQGHDVMFDIDNARVGFAESDCNYRAPLEVASRSANPNTISNRSALTVSAWMCTTRTCHRIVSIVWGLSFIVSHGWVVWLAVQKIISLRCGVSVDSSESGCTENEKPLHETKPIIL